MKFPTQTSIRIAKNSIFGSYNEPEEMYCPHCYHKIDNWFMNNTLSCLECKEKLNYATQIITKNEMRERKIKDLSNEY